MKHTRSNCFHRDYCDKEYCMKHFGGPEACHAWKLSEEEKVSA